VAADKRWTTPFALFGEVVITGILVAALALPVVTALPALATGTAHLRRHLTGESVGLADALRDFVAACRALWPAALAFVGVALLLLWNLSLAQAGVVPGSDAVLVVSVLLLIAWAVVLLRAATAWPADSPAALLRAATQRTFRDPAGSVLLAFACGMCGLFVWMLLPLALIAGGLLALAAVAVDLRARERLAP
jgi:hypothetical protein